VSDGGAAGWVEVGDRVFVRRYAFFDQSIGAVVGPSGVTIVDTRSTEVQGREILDDLRRLTPLPVAAVIDTHHHYDHTFGNRVFRPAPIWGHVRCRERLLTEAETARTAAIAEVPELRPALEAVVVDPPERVFEETAVIDAGGRRVEARFLGRGHTDDDVVVLVPDVGVLFAGDLLENDAVPYFGDAYPLDWPETVSRLLELVRAAVVPGHGRPADRVFVEDQLAGFLAVAELGRRVQRGQLTREEAVASGPYEAFRAGASGPPIARALAQLRGELDRP